MYHICWWSGQEYHSNDVGVCRDTIAFKIYIDFIVSCKFINLKDEIIKINNTHIYIFFDRHSTEVGGYVFGMSVHPQSGTVAVQLHDATLLTYSTG